MPKKTKPPASHTETRLQPAVAPVADPAATQVVASTTAQAPAVAGLEATRVVAAQPFAAGPVVAPGSRPTRHTRREARRVRRILYGFELWSVLKISLLFYLCVWGVFMLAGLLLWSFAISSGYIERFENFILEIFNYETFKINGSEIFEWYVWAGLFCVLALTALTVVLCLLYNLISVLVGGLRITIVEEETVRLRPSIWSRLSRGVPPVAAPPATSKPPPPSASSPPPASPSPPPSPSNAS